MKQIRKENINTVEYWNRVYSSERRTGQRRLYTGLWETMLKYMPAGRCSLIDIGCGTGEFLKYLAQKRPEYDLYGTDQSAEGLLTASRNCPKASLFLAGAGSLNLPRADFDIGTLCEVLEHIPEPFGFMAGAVDAVRLSGLVLCTTPWIWGPSCPEHLWDYESPQDIVLLGGGRLELVDWSVTSGRRFLLTVLQRVL